MLGANPKKDENQLLAVSFHTERLKILSYSIILDKIILFFIVNQK